MRFNRFCFHLRFITTGRSKERRQCVNSKIVVDEGKVVTNENGNCRPREQIENGRVINVPTKDGMVAEYKCDPFFRLKGSFVLLFFLFFCFFFVVQIQIVLNTLFLNISDKTFRKVRTRCFSSSLITFTNL